MSDCEKCGSPKNYILGARKLREKIERQKTIIRGKSEEVKELKKRVGSLQSSLTKLTASYNSKISRLKSRMTSLRKRLDERDNAQSSMKSLHSMRKKLDEVSDDYAEERRRRALAEVKLERITQALGGFL